ncbi:unnamed protein product [Rotaria sp. Silwood1]|nr:unnamed protein product [Rotaria sp. Silwood1]CAF1618145.1 unnamed protein product [Rotaria sp. Silwood1]CAF3764205.1 unnamed protein product [Rotaria sp. Silwood1]CAF4953964.1 unnamed protein product [Rotaria sp. Silwood1]
MLPTTINSTEPTNDTTSTTTTIDNQINNNLIETLPCNALCRQKLFNLLSSTHNIEKHFIENIYYECIQLQIQINHANRQINQYRNLLQIEHIQINDQQPTNDYLKLLADLLTSQLTSLSGMMQQTDK